MMWGCQRYQGVSYESGWWRLAAIGSICPKYMVYRSMSIKKQ